MPEISVIVPAYNRAAYLAETLRSCQAQTLIDLETIVVDDGSEEDLAEVVECARRETGRSRTIRYMRQPRLGANAARNRGLREASGAFIQFLDSDDLLHPQKLERQCQGLREAPLADMVFCLDLLFKQRPGDSDLLWNKPDERDSLDRFLWDDPVWNTNSPLWRRAALDRIGPWAEELICWQDWEYHIRALCLGVRPHFIPEALQYVRDHGQARSTNLAPAAARERSRFRAAQLVAEALQSASAWTPSRRDALAVFLMSTAADQSRAHDLDGARLSLGMAKRFAGWPAGRWLARLLTSLVEPSRWLAPANRPPLWLAYRAARAFGAVPRYDACWKRISLPRDG